MDVYHWSCDRLCRGRGYHHWSCDMLSVVVLESVQVSRSSERYRSSEEDGTGQQGCEEGGACNQRALPQGSASVPQLYSFISLCLMVFIATEGDSESSTQRR